MYKVKLFGFVPLDLTWLIQIVINALANIVDGFVKGQELTIIQKMIVRTLYFLADEWGEWVAKDTETPYDDEAVQQILKLCEDTAQEGEFPLPDVQEL